MIRKLLVIVLVVFCLSLLAIVYLMATKGSKAVPRPVREVEPLRKIEDVRVSASIKTALALNRYLKDFEIDVDADSGTVTLSGEVRMEIQKELAGNIASSIRGVEFVRNNLAVTHEPFGATPAGERSLGERLDDLTTTASVKTALALNDNLDSSRIEVKTFRSIVTLEGSVPLQVKKELAESISYDVTGVTDVHNSLAVVPAALAEAKPTEVWKEKLDDAWIATRVRTALLVNRNINFLRIDVNCKDGMVTLTGEVNTGYQKTLAENTARSAGGVMGVTNQLVVQQRAPWWETLR